MTGPQTSDASGNKNGKFAYMEASQRKQGDNVRLLSPKIQGENCLSLMYHMYGGSLGSLIIYLNTSSNETVEWIKSGNHPDQWFEAAVFFNTSVEYQRNQLTDLAHHEFFYIQLNGWSIQPALQRSWIVLEGVRGSDFASDIAIDNITEELDAVGDGWYHISSEKHKLGKTRPLRKRKKLQVTDDRAATLLHIEEMPDPLLTLTMHAFIKEDSADFKIDRVPAHSNWIHQFSLQVVQTWNSSSDVMYFVYPGDKTNCAKSVTRQLFLADFNCFPLDFFFASAINRSDYGKVLLFKQAQKLSYGIGLDDYPNCRGQTIEDYFYANLSLPKISFCPSGWHALGESCFQLNTNPLKSWADGQRECRMRGGRLAVFEKSLTTRDLTKFLEDYMEYSGQFYSGAHSVRTRQFSTIEYKLFNRTSSLWGPGEPSGDGSCGNMLLGQKGWRVNDESCYTNIGFVCQKKKNTSVSECEISWFNVGGLCFRVYVGNISATWDEARYFCKKRGGDLAVVDSELKRKAIDIHLHNVSLVYHHVVMNKAHIGLRRLVMWQWPGGSNISSSYWHRGEHDDLKVGNSALVMRRSSAWKLAKEKHSDHGFLCQTNKRKNLL
ncbi:MAM and LDL-receptor class A domain-containing protein 2 [Acropora cervicornis]|uniref:MAM and LDL-receptor class A domain-containing protein 2 n=1 Tax=Acropora cervicornis TaxID=6130 RepID=A0AAD9VBL9_ACRCE|nr:MAM and LDL-receptor class A domain-containing protein 2 [Acropora cervicornis]